MKKMRFLLLLVGVLLISAGTLAIINDRASHKQQYSVYETEMSIVTEEVEENTDIAEVEPGSELEPSEPPMKYKVFPLLVQSSGAVGWLDLDGYTYLSVSVTPTETGNVYAGGYNIMQDAGDNEYYLHHDVNGAENIYGSIYLDSNHSMDESGLHVIYGHHMKDGRMFGELANMTDPEFFSEHLTGRIYTRSETIELQAVYAYAGRADGSYRNNITSPEDLQAFIAEKTGLALNVDDIYVLITCSYGSEDERTYVFYARADAIE